VTEPVSSGERIQKLLATAGVGSRRGIEEWMRAGRLTVNGQVARLGDRARVGDQFALDGKPLQVAISAAGAPEAQAPATSILIYHKPVGEVTTRHDPQGRPTVFERLPAPPVGRWVVVGRLDTNTSGLLLFTNDGALAHRLMHPSFEVERRYLVRVRGTPGPELEARLLKGVMLEDGLARFGQVQPRGRSEGHSWFEVSLREGRNREVRRVFETLGYEVSRLKRLSYGPFVLPEELAAGKSLQLSPAQVAEQMARL
jgi:23S rRNA pseudouridine2605 synthase